MHLICKLLYYSRAQKLNLDRDFNVQKCVVAECANAINFRHRFLCKTPNMYTMFYTGDVIFYLGNKCYKFVIFLMVIV